MPILSDKDFFDFDGYARRITELEGLTEGWAQSLVASVGRIRSSFDAAQKDVDSFEKNLKSISITKDGGERQVIDYIQKLGQAAERSTVARQSLAALNDAQKLNSQVVTELSGKLGGLHQKYQSLDRDQTDYAKQQRAILTEVKTVTRAIDAQSKSLQVSKSTIDAAEGSLNHLRKQTADLKKTLDALPNAYDRSTGKINEQDRAVVALNNQYQKNIALINKVEQGQRVFSRNVGNYPQASQSASAVGLLSTGASRLAGAGLAIAGIDSALGAIQKVGDITLEFDSLDSALKVVSNDTTLFTQRQAKLAQISEDLGQDLSVVERNYTNLTASSKGTRLEGEATDKIFEQIVGTMGRLKKPADDVNGALLAVGQMMSKGTVQSEELRGQLGERLPGAFNIAAKAMGVTTQKLSDMLKNGEVLASDFLPKFAAELEKTFNPNNERRVEGLAANLARLRNEGVEWVKGLNIGDTAGEWIGNITRMARSVRELFAPAVETASQRLTEQTDVVQHLESVLPGLLSRYDELSSKAKLSTEQQTELRSIVNQIVNLVPNAATGFDRYGNALDINKGKVLSFASAQRELNAELNKAAIDTLRDQTSGNMERVAKNQAVLNRGTKQQSFNFKPYFLRSDEERRQSVDKDPGKRREVALTDDDRRGLASQLQEENKKIELSIVQRLQLGDKLTAVDKKYIDEGNSSNLKRYKAVEGYNEKIAELDTKQADLFIKGDKESLKQRDAVLKDLASYKDKVTAILNPTLSAKPTIGDKPEQSQAAINKAKAAAEKALRDAMSISKATTDQNVGKLNDDRQDGIIDEQTFIEKRLQLTLKGLNERQSLLEKYNKKESDDYINVLRDKEKAETDYKRSQLQLDLKSNKTQTDKKVADIDASDFKEGTNDLAYIEKRHAIIEQGIRRDQATIREAGLQQSEIYKKSELALLDEQTDYLKRRARAEEVDYKKQLADTKDALGEINKSIAVALEEQLQQLDKYYQEEESKVQVAVKKGKMTPAEGDAQIHSLKLIHLREEQVAIENSYNKDRNLSNALIDDKIKKLTDFRNHSVLTTEEITDVETSLSELRKLRNQEELADKKKHNKDIAENTEKTSKQTTDTELANIEKVRNKRQALIEMSLQLASTLGDATFSILSGNNERETQQLEQQHDRELQLAGDNADAKARIEDQYQRRKRELARKAAIAEREQALFSIAINTAMAVASVLSTGGGTRYADLGISAGILSAFVIAAGIAQSAAVLAKPIPAYKYGKLETDTYTGPALAGEAGAELFVDREGASQLLQRPTIIDTKRGDTIYTAHETASIISSWKKGQVSDMARAETDLNRESANTLRAGREMVSNTLLREVLNPNPSLRPMTAQQFHDIFLQVWQKAPRHETIIDFEGMKQATREGNNLHEYREKRYKW